MATIPFSKLNLKVAEEVKEIPFDNQTVIVKQYLPVAEKLKLISNVVNLALAEDENFANPIKVDIFSTIEIIKAYTNVTFEDEELDNPAALYDLLDSTDFVNEIIVNIPKAEYAFVVDGIEECIESIYKYRNSAMGIMETITHDYSNLDLEASDIQKKMADPNNLTLLKDVLTKLG